MRIVKPYGRTQTEYENGALRRALYRRPGPESSPPNGPDDIERFALAHDELVIAQWISAIDKIAAKPSGKDGATEEQRQFRNRLGKAAWKIIEENALLPGLQDPETRARLVELWKAKIAPYGTTPFKPRKGRPGKPSPTPPSAKGRWYARFAGDAETADADVEAIAAEIHEHLYVAERRISGKVPNRKCGRIPARARSISGNVLRPAQRSCTGWSPDDEAAYMATGNVAGEIHAAAIQREKGEDDASTRRVSLDIAGAALFRHYACVFRDEQGVTLRVCDAKQRMPGLFNLHMAVKDCYARILKHHRKDAHAHGARRRKVSHLLPQDMTSLLALVKTMTANRDLNALIRLGKIIHYEASRNNEDAPAASVDKWPVNIADSYFWSSQGQARIKRNEAFVRVWRHVLALAARTLTDWADPEEKIVAETGKEILLNDSIKEATGNRFDSRRYPQKIELLFGKRAGIFLEGGDDFHKKVLEAALKGVANLRHAAFHFKGLASFTGALRTAAPNETADVPAAIASLWQADIDDRAGQLWKTLQGAHLGHFFDENQCRRIADALSETDLPPLPLPRFQRVLKRTENVRKNTRGWTNLPAPANRDELEVPARHCQHTALKLLYERPFRRWLAERDTAALDGFIRRAVERATKAANELAGKDDEKERGLIVSRAERLGYIEEDGTIESFFFALSAATASEMRVQRGYESDPEKARKQAGFIEDLKCDVVALAFDDYLTKEGLHFILTLPPDSPKPDDPLFDLEALQVSVHNPDVEAWQRYLYFLLHLVPVEEAGKLLHQIRKWDILAGRPDVKDTQTSRQMATGLCAVLELYLDMHDAKFEGANGLTGIEPFKDLFESETIFDSMFPAQPGAEEDDRIPKRGLREIARFGNLSVLLPLFEKHAVNEKDIRAFQNAERKQYDGKTAIAEAQERREKLHKKWTKRKKEFSGDDCRQYAEALTKVIEHRHLASHVTLTNHVRLHRLMMTVLGRFADFSGLWERDLYFVTLAAVHNAGLTLDTVFNRNGLDHLRDGQIVSALGKMYSTHEACKVLDELEHYFGTGFLKKNGAVKIRNDFAHFNMLRRARLPVDLTACVNNARQLMSYDRKLKNAVPQSIAEILDREGISLQWKMDADHRLGGATVATRQAMHLGQRSFSEKKKRETKHPIAEDLHGKHFVEMVASLFGGTAGAPARTSVTGFSLDAIDWNPPRKQKQNGQQKNWNDGSKNEGRNRGKRRSRQRKRA